MNWKKARLVVGVCGSALLIFAFQNCGSRDSGTSTSDPSDKTLMGTSSGNPGGGAKILFSTVQKKVFQPACVACHRQGGEVSQIQYDNYSMTLATGKLDNLLAAYTNHKEPSRACASIRSADMDLVVQWIADGALK